MVEENAIRAEVSPWEQAMVAVRARDAGSSPRIDAAVDALYPSLTRQKRTASAPSPIWPKSSTAPSPPPRPVASASSCASPPPPRGFGDLIRHALGESGRPTPTSQWRPSCPSSSRPRPPNPPSPAPRPRPPRRMLEPRRRPTVRRELTRDGWTLHFTGREATGMLIDAVIDEIERMFAPVEPREPFKHVPPRHLW